MSQRVAKLFNVFNGTDDAIIIQVKQKSRQTGSVTNIQTPASVTRALITILSETPVNLDSAVSPALITWNTTGKFTIILGGESIPEGEYSFRLIIVDGGKDKQLVHEDVQDAKIKFNDTTIPA